MYRKLSVFVAAIAVAGVGAYFIVDITKQDIMAANSFTRAAESEPLTAGDIVVVPDRGPMSRICNAVVAEQDLLNDQKQEVYFNRAGKFIGWSVGLAHQLGLIGDAKALALSGQGLPFVGNASSLSGAEYTYVNPQACECAIARTLSRGERVCGVSASLIETSEALRSENGRFVLRPVERSVAVTLRRHVMSLSEAAFSACNVPFTPAAGIVQQELCSDTIQPFPMDVRLRRYLNLIVSEPLNMDVALSR